MGYRTLRQCVEDLERAGHLLRLDSQVDACLEAAEIHRRVFRSGGPAILYENVKGCRFPMVSNLFGSIDRARFLFRDSLASVRRLIELKANPHEVWKTPQELAGLGRTAISMLPRKVRSGPILDNQITTNDLPQQKSWPDDGGAFITLGAVYTEDVDHPGLSKSNLGMYRVQLSGGHYETGREIGLHYQIHRGIGVHHSAAIRRGVPFRVNIFVGGAPCMPLAAVTPLPEGMSELSIAGALGRQRIRMICRPDQLPIYADADFCITGTVDADRQLPEGPFGDHLGYYSLAHDFPVLKVDSVWHRKGAIWPFTVVGRPPQEDTFFGQLIHDLTGPAIPTVLPGVHAVHAVDATGVHPLLLALGSERYVPYRERSRPQELLTQANAILGQGQLSLAKYLFIAAKEDNPELDIHHVDHFLQHVLERVDWARDLHFQTTTTMDTLDYSGTGLNEGSKLVVAAVGRPIRKLAVDLPLDFFVPDGFRHPRICIPGVLAIQGPAYDGTQGASDRAIDQFCSEFSDHNVFNGIPLIIVVDDSDFTAATLNNLLWITFTRSNPAADISGIRSFIHQKHWGCHGSLVIDARIKPHHAPPLTEDPEIVRRVDALASRGGPLAKYL